MLKKGLRTFCTKKTPHANFCSLNIKKMLEFEASMPLIANSSLPIR